MAVSREAFLHLYCWKVKKVVPRNSFFALCKRDASQRDFLFLGRIPSSKKY